VRIQVLGSLTVTTTAGSAIEILGARQRRLLALLARRVGRTLPAEVLSHALWEVEDVRDPRGALHSLVARVRRALDASGERGVLRTDPTGYRLDAEHTSVDAFRFEEILRDADDAPPPDRAERLAEALSLWHGRAYDEFVDVDELRLEGIRLDELRRVAAERYGAALVEAGRAADAVAHLQRLVEEEPFREGAVAALMRALESAGRQGEALRCFARYRDRLADELGLEPSRALVQLEQSIAVEPTGPPSWQSPRPPEKLDHRPANRDVDALVDAGWAAVRRGDATAALAAFERATELEPSGRTLEGTAEAIRMEDDHGRRSRDMYERAYRAYRDEGDALGAYRAARVIAFYHGGVEGEWALFEGWLHRAGTLLEAIGGERERAWRDLIIGQYGSVGDDEREARFRDGLAVGRRHRDADLELQALAYLGAHLVKSGRVGEGMPMLDEALAAVSAGEVSDLNIFDEVLCVMLEACERAHDVSRAAQWMRSANDLAERFGLRTMAALCRAHYGGILTAAGRWDEAEDELLASARGLADGARSLTANATTRLALLRVRQGRLDEAESLLSGLDENPDSAVPLAALHLARGRHALARDRLERALAQTSLGAGAGPLLALLVDVELQARDTNAATAAAERLESLARETPTLYLRASAALAVGKLCLATSSGDPWTCFVDALALFTQAELPVEAARTRMLLARAVADERPEVALAEASAALEAFRALQVEPEAAAASALLRTLHRDRPAGTTGLTPRETDVLALLGEGLTNAEIGERLYISRKTVEHHVSRVLAKLGLRTRTEAAAHAVRLLHEKSGFA
jgi:DNA-binding SARP family transcriptional activator/DNA-binding CsgD family transcriptional regulator/Tfp pilus assembly protein PilF